MWNGYLKKDKSFNEFASRYNIPIENIHVSGHIFKDKLFDFIDEIQPKKIFPVHTLGGEILEKKYKNVII